MSLDKKKHLLTEMSAKEIECELCFSRHLWEVCKVDMHSSRAGAGQSGATAFPGGQHWDSDTFGAAYAVNEGRSALYELSSLAYICFIY